ncbi:MAG: glycosyl hydrolase [Ignavibacteriaceae bacterium]
MAFQHDLINSITLSKENFKIPPKAMGVLPFWFWNGEMNEQEMEWQLKEYHDKGIPGLFIHGRFGEKIGYLSETWFERVKFAVEKGKDIGIDIWIYDEMNWPSGTAERQVLKKYPHLTQKYLELVALQVDGPLFTFLEATDSRYVNTGDSKPIAAYACSADEFENGIKNLIDLTPNLSFNKVIPWEAPEGKWKLLYFLEKEIPYYIDALNPESTNRFLEITHEGYKKAVGNSFGSTVPGFFTDEPAMHYYHVGIDNFVVPWSSQMFKIFRKLRGYDLKPYLPALYANMGEITSKIRYDFWRTLSEQYSVSYYKRIRDWCDENGVLFTGHLLFEEWLRLQARCEGNIFHHLQHMHIIGVDHLYPKIGTEKEPDQHVALKLASSAAHHYGSKQLLCESMGGTYWDCTLERMKWIGNWEYVLGVTIFNNHGYHYSIEGERKRDWPPSQFYHHTWWKNYNIFTSYMSRLGHILSGGRHVAKVLILYPLNSIWTNYVPQERNEVGNLIESEFNYLTDTLLRLHFDFDYVDENVLAESIIDKGKIKIADEEYSLLIIPPVTHIKATTFFTIKKFLNTGGKLIADTILPTGLLDYEKKDAHKKIEDLFGKNPEKILHNFSKGAKFKVFHKKSKGDIFFLEGKGLFKENKKDELEKVLNNCISPDVTINNENIFYLHRVKDNNDVYFFTNISKNDINEVEITFERIGRPEFWNPNTGSIEGINIYQIKNGRLSIKLDFPPAESRLIILNEDITKPFISESNLRIESFDGLNIIGYSGNSKNEIFAKVETEINVKNFKVKPKSSLKPIKLGKKFRFYIEEDNILSISKWKMKLQDEFEIPDRYWLPEFEDKNWLDVTTGAWEMQLPQERSEEKYPVTLWYRTSFNIAILPANTRILIDGFSGLDYLLFINGQEIKDKGHRSKIDSEIKEIDIQEFVKIGKNYVTVRLIAGRRTDGILDLLKIVGKFSLSENKNEYVIDKEKSSMLIGDWTQQGYPFFSGTGVYETELNVPYNYTNGKLFLDVDCGEDVLEVIVNDGKGIVIPWHPYRIDINGLIKVGNNKIVLKVTNTLINILEAVQKKSGIFTEPQLQYENKYEICTTEK